MSSSQRGFSLVDLMIIIAVAAVVAAIAIPSIANDRRDENAAVCQENQQQISEWIAKYVTAKQQVLQEQKQEIKAAVADFLLNKLEEEQPTVDGELQAETTFPNAGVLIEAGYPRETFVNPYAPAGTPPGTGFDIEIDAEQSEEGQTSYEVKITSTNNYRIGPSGGLLSDPDSRPNARELIDFGAPEDIFYCPERAEFDEPLGMDYALRGVTGDVECATDSKGDRHDPNAQYQHTLD